MNLCPPSVRVTPDTDGEDPTMTCHQVMVQSQTQELAAPTKGSLKNH